MADARQQPGASSQRAQEFIIKACGAQHADKKYFVGKFPLGWPDLSHADKRNLSLSREAAPAAAKGGAEQSQRVAPWLLRGKHDASTSGGAGGSAAGPLFRGQMDGGLSNNSAAGYFMVVKEGQDFVAIPVGDFFNFRPVPRHRPMSLEQAEAVMRGQRLAYEKASTKLNQFAPTDETGTAIAASAAEPPGASVGSPGAPQPHAPAGGGAGGVKGEAYDPLFDDEAAEEEEVAVKAEKAEDWEHEQDNADDDLDMGESEGEAEPGPQPQRRRGPGSESEGEEDAEEGGARGGALDGAGREVARILRTRGSASSDEEEGESGEEDEEIDDEDDLDRMASTQPILAARPRSRSPSPLPPAVAAGGAKRKAAEPARPSAAPAAAAAAAKKARRSPTPPPAAAVAGGGGGATQGVAQGVTSQDLESFLRAAPPQSVTLTDLTARFKPMVKAGGQKAFAALVKSMVRLVALPDGRKVVELKMK